MGLPTQLPCTALTLCALSKIYPANLPIFPTLGGIAQRWAYDGAPYTRDITGLTVTFCYPCIFFTLLSTLSLLITQNTLHANLIVQSAQIPTLPMWNTLRRLYSHLERILVARGHLMTLNANSRSNVASSGVGPADYLCDTRFPGACIQRCRIVRFI